MTEVTHNGRCFQAALAAARDLVELNDKHIRMIRVVHGTPIGQGGQVDGVRYWHAWVEFERRGQYCVIDDSQGKQLVVLRSDYYRIGHLDASTVWRFSIKEARIEMDKREHAGPWVDNYQEVAL